MSAYSINAPVAVPERVRLVMGMIHAAAAKGQRCPSNDEIAGKIRAESTSTAANFVTLLENMGLISVQRFHTGRVVTIAANGLSTAPVSGRALTFEGRKRVATTPKPAAQIDRNELDAFADALAAVGTVSGAARHIGVNERKGHALFALIRSELGAQAA